MEKARLSRALACLAIRGLTDLGSYRLVLLRGSWDLRGSKDGTTTGTEAVVLGEDDVTVDLYFPR